MSLEDSNTGDLEGILNALDSEVFSEKLWNESNFYKVAEVTYNYKNISSLKGVEYKDDTPEDAQGPQLNETLFCDLGDLNIKNFTQADESGRVELLKASKQTLESKITDKIHRIEESYDQIQQVDAHGDDALEARKRIILGGLEEIKMQLQACILGIPFEIEKALIGIHFFVEGENLHVISSEAREGQLAKIKEINTKIYGPALAENNDYVVGCIDYYFTAYKKYNEEKETEDFSQDRKLTEDERRRYEGYLKKLKLLASNHEEKELKKPKKYIDSRYEKIKKYKADIVAGFNHHTKASGLQQIAKLDSSVKGMTDTPKGIRHPDDDPKFDSLTLEREKKLNSHEVGQHDFSISRHMSLIGNIRGSKNLEMAEGSAKLFEDLFEYGPNLLTNAKDEDGKDVQIIDISKLGYVQNFPKTLMEEILDDVEFYDFLILNNKVEPDKMGVNSRYLRHKRTGIQRKDITYTTGKIKAAKYYNDIITKKNKTGKFSDLYIGKVGFDQIEDFRIVEKAANDNNPGLKLPENMLFYEAEHFAVEQRKKRKVYRASEEFKALDTNSDDYKTALKKYAVNEENFYTYLQEKYPFMDFGKEKIASVTHGFKKQLLGAISLTENAIEMHERGINPKVAPLYRSLRLEEKGKIDVSGLALAQDNENTRVRKAA
ncbi:hypothetical protein N9J72_00075 [Candidatus Gracilibacteria bacterium]|nr:hypothetical protein [Candidatus Gracilibacteria bacterium]